MMKLRESSERMTIVEAIDALRRGNPVPMTKAIFLLERLGAHRLAGQVRTGLWAPRLRAIRFLKAVKEEARMARSRE